MLNSGRMMGASSEIDNGWKASKSYNVNLDLTGENWIFYLDEIFDYEKNTLTSAPCAIVMDKNCFSKGDIHVSAYGVKTSLELPRGNEKARFALFEFHKKSNSEALEWLKINVDKIQDIIKNADFSTSPRAQAEMLRQLDMTAKLLIELRTAAGKELQAKEKKLREKILNSGQLDVIKIRELKTDINSLHEKVTEAGLADLIAPQAHENNK
jgi:hypothetical protein